MKALKKGKWLAAFLMAAVLGASAGAQQTQSTQTAQPPQYQQPAAPITLEKIAENIYQVKGGSGANCGVHRRRKGSHGHRRQDERGIGQADARRGR